jgi:hypothetical protein
MKRSSALGTLAALGLPVRFEAVAAAADDRAAPAMTDAAAIVGREVDAFNAHDAATVTKMHAPDAVLTLLPSGKVLAKGSDQLLAFFVKNFSDNPKANIVLEKQFVLKNVVVNQYSTGTGAGIVSIYEVANGVIANEWVILG